MQMDEQEADDEKEDGESHDGSHGEDDQSPDDESPGGDDDDDESHEVPEGGFHGQEKAQPQLQHHEHHQDEQAQHQNHDHEDSSSLHLDLHQLHDDTDIAYEPSSHVDYLSHNWVEGDISKSWRYIVLRRKDVANSARLENASWRTWAQAKYRLKTVSPESVNWLKDSDVTWLYGPLYKEERPKTTYSYGSDGEAKLKPKPKRRKRKLKPILKKRTVSEMLQPVPRVKSPSPAIFNDFEMITERVNAQYVGTPDDAPRHIHFNDRVEQCISLNPEESVMDDDSDSDDEGGFFLNVKSAGLSSAEENKYQTIGPLPSTTLNYGSDADSDSESEQFVVSHRTDTGRGYNYRYDYNSVYPNPDHVHIGQRDYELEDTPQHLEGVAMVDVPEDIMLGASVELADEPEYVEYAQHTDDPQENSSTDPARSLPKISPSPSSASLSDVAAQGFIQGGGGSNALVDDLQRDFNSLSSSDDSTLRSVMSSWKKN